MLGSKVRESSPLGPFTLTVEPSTVTVTLVGMVTGFLPILDMSTSPHQRHDFAANLVRASLLVGHHSLGSRNDGDAQAAPNARQIFRRLVNPTTRPRDTFDVADHRLVFVITQVQAQHSVCTIIQDLVVLNEVVLLQNARDFCLELRHRHVYTLMSRL